MALGRLGITLNQLYIEYTPRILFNHINGYWDHNNQHLQSRWEVARFTVVPLINLNLKKSQQLKPLDYARFPWEKSIVTKKPPPPNLSKKEEREKLKQKFTQ